MTDWRPTHDDPLFMLAMDHRESYASLFGIRGAPSPGQREQLRSVKGQIFDALLAARERVTAGRAGVLVDEQYGERVIRRAKAEHVELAVPLEASGLDWFELVWGDLWLAHLEESAPDFAKVLVRDNPALDSESRAQQFTRLATVSAALRERSVPLIFELLVAATPEQTASVGGDALRYDTELRPALTVQVMTDLHDHGVEPAIWKVEGVETSEAAHALAAAAVRDGRTADLIVLGRDAPADRLDHWIQVAAGVPGFVGFAIGRSIWEDEVPILAAVTPGSPEAAAALARVTERYLGFVDAWVRK